MYSFLVTSNKGAWNLQVYEYPRDRFAEYSSPQALERFKELNAATIEELKSYPALFAYEGREGNVRIGYIRRIKERSRSIVIEYEFEDRIPEIPFSKIAPLEMQLDIEKWEMNRTHWAIKDEDLFEILSSAGLIDKTFSSSAGPPRRIEEMKFKVALSFPGERRAYVHEVAAELKRRLPQDSVFYDRDFTAQLARPNLDTLLQLIYRKNSDLVVVFLSGEYESKEWCGLEWRAIRDIIKSKADYSVMLMRFDDALVSGSLSVDGYVDLRRLSPVQAATLVLQRVRG